jgi:NlpC/P60 family
VSEQRAQIAAALSVTLSELERDLVRRFGFTMLEAHVAEITADGEVLVAGTALVPRLGELLSARLAERLPGRQIRCALAGLQGSGWFLSRSSPLCVFRELRPESARSLATELLAWDGPVERLLECGSRTLVRDMCGTVGWIDELLDERCDRPQIAPTRDRVEAFVAQLRELSGVPYLLGGTTSNGIDCSGLVQRAARGALGLLLPRHTTDQRAFAASADALHGCGDLIFTWTERDGACHVGVVTEYRAASRGDLDEARVIHASLSRRRVVEEPLSAFASGATRVEYARYSDLILRHAEHVGAAQIQLRG